MPNHDSMMMVTIDGDLRSGAMKWGLPCNFLSPPPSPNLGRYGHTCYKHQRDEEDFYHCLFPLLKTCRSESTC